MRWSSRRIRSTRSSALRCPSWRRKTSRICSRLLDRLPPAGFRRLMSGSVGNSIGLRDQASGIRAVSGLGPDPEAYRESVMAAAALAGDTERLAASTGRRGLGILDGKTPARHGIDEVDLSSLQVADADRIDEQPHAVRLIHLVAHAAGLFDHQSVLEARAAAALHEDAETAASFTFFGEQLVDFRGCGRGHINHRFESPGKAPVNYSVGLGAAASRTGKPAWTACRRILLCDIKLDGSSFMHGENTTRGRPSTDELKQLVDTQLHRLAEARPDPVRAVDVHRVRFRANELGVSPDIHGMVPEFARGAFGYLLQTHPLPAGDANGAVNLALAGWDRGFCPACGSWPALAEAGTGGHQLRCSFCAARWALASYRCVYCANRSRTFVTAAPDLQVPGRRLQLCGACGGYVKVLEVPAPAPFPLVAVEDLATMDLDLVAIERKYMKPALAEIKKA